MDILWAHSKEFKVLFFLFLFFCFIIDSLHLKFPFLLDFCLSFSSHEFWLCDGLRNNSAAILAFLLKQKRDLDLMVPNKGQIQIK